MINNDLANKISIGSQPYLGGLTIGNVDSMSYIYSENGDLNFRYQVSGDDQPNYISISNLHDYYVSGGFRLYYGYWSDLDSSFTDVNKINVSGIANTTDTFTNLPSDSDGWGTLVSFYNSDMIQLYFGWNSGQLWFRVHHIDYGWEEWVNLTSTSNKATTALNKATLLESSVNTISQQISSANGNIDWLKYNIKSAELNTDNNIQFKWRDGNIIICVDWEEVIAISRNI